MRVKVIKEFVGVIDGTIHPRVVEVGEIIDGDLGDVALKEMWATDKFEESAREPTELEKKLREVQETEAPAAAAATPSAADATAGEAKAMSNSSLQPVAAGMVEIPEDWQTKPYFSIRKWAEDIKGAPIADKAEAKTIIEAELARRAELAAAK